MNNTLPPTTHAQPAPQFRAMPTTATANPTSENAA
jgi:hypothetical protein